MFAAAQRIDTLVVLCGLKTKAVEHAGNHAFPGIAVRLFKALDQTVIVGGKPGKPLLVGMGMRHFIFKFTQLFFHSENLLVDFLQLVPNGFAAGYHVLLSEISHARAANKRNFATVLRVQPCKNAHKRRFAAAVYTHKPDAIALLHGQRDIPQHGVYTESFGDVLGG